MLFAVLCAALAAVVSASTLLTRQATATGLVTGCVDDSKAALTFDDGPSDNLRKLVDTIVAAGVKATICINGDNYYCIYNSTRVADLQYAYSKGIEICSHTWSHANLTALTNAQIKVELERLNNATENILGVSPRIFRPPYGEYNSNVGGVARQMGMIAVGWNFDSGDSTGATPEESKAEYDNIPDSCSGGANGCIMLNHETEETSVDDVLPHAIKDLQDEGYDIVTLSECLGLDSAYTVVQQPANRSFSWHC